MGRRSLQVVFAVLVVCLPVAGGAPRDAGPRPLAPGSLAPDFTFDSGAGPQRLADFNGKPVVVNFWATWCHPCDDELDAFARLSRTYGEAVPILAISDESREVASAFLKSHGVDARVIADPDHKIFGRYGVAPIPVTVVLDRAGAVSHVSIGELDWPELQAAVEQASAVAGPAPGATPT